MKAKMILVILCTIMFLAVCGISIAQNHSITSVRDIENIIPMREQVKIMDRWWKWKLEHVLPEVMHREGVDMWLVSRSEDFLYVSLLQTNEEGMTFRRPAFLIFYDRGEHAGIEHLEARNLDELAKTVKERNPQKIGIRDSERAEIKAALGDEYASRFVSSRTLSMGWLETKPPEEISAYRHVVGVAHEIIAEAFSNKVIISDITTLGDVNWWVRLRIIGLGLDTDDHPTVTLMRSKKEIAHYDDPPENFAPGRPSNGLNMVIRRGDMIHADTGIKYLGLVTDIQPLAYVLKEGETDAPEGLKRALRNANRVQDIFAAEFREGRGGDDVARSADEKAKGEGLQPRIYSHPIPYYLMRFSRGGGFFTRVPYGAGTSFNSDGRPREIFSGDYPLHFNTVYAMELSNTTFVSEWDDDIRIGVEQVVAFTEKGVIYLDGRQTEFYLIK